MHGKALQGCSPGGDEMTTRHRQLNLIIQRVFITDSDPFDTFNNVQTETTERVWARREDSVPRNEIEADTGALFPVNESRYFVRQATPAWNMGDIIVDEAGRRRRVTGAALAQQHGEMDGRMIQLLVEGYGGL